MVCPGCGGEIAGDASFCTYCGSRTAPGTSPGAPASPLPVPPATMGLPADQPRAAASQDRRLALIILGVVVGAAVLVVILAAILMLLLAADEDDGVDTSKLEIRMTMQAIGDPTGYDMKESAEIIRERLKAFGIKDYRVTIGIETNRLYIEIPGTKDIERIKRIIGATGQLQFRQVLDIIGPGDPEYDITVVTMVDCTDEEAYRALEDQEIVLEKQEDNDTVVKVKLGPTLLTGNIIDSADAQADKFQSSEGYLVNFTLTDAATSQFGELTTEMQSQTAPLNQLAIVLDYLIMSYPTVQSAITDGKGQITGDFTKQDAEDLVLVLQADPLPVDFNLSDAEIIK